MHELDLTPKSGRQDFWTPLQRLFRPPKNLFDMGGPQRGAAGACTASQAMANESQWQPMDDDLEDDRRKVRRCRSRPSYLKAVDTT